MGWLPAEAGPHDRDLLALLARYDDQTSTRGPLAAAWNVGLGDLVELGAASQGAYAPRCPPTGWARARSPSPAAWSTSISALGSSASASVTSTPTPIRPPATPAC